MRFWQLALAQGCFQELVTCAVTEDSVFRRTLVLLNASSYWNFIMSLQGSLYSFPFHT